MKIAIDISQIVYETGVSVYTQNLVMNLLKIDNDNKYVLFGGSLRKYHSLEIKSKEIIGSYNNKVELRLFRYPPTLSHLVWNVFHKIPIERLIGKIDILHSSDWVQPPTLAKKVTTVHDLVPLLYPEYSKPKIVKVHSARFKYVQKEVDMIISPSNATKNDLENLGISPDKIIVISESFDPIYIKDKSNSKKIREIYNIRLPYLLVVGTSPRKNITNIFRSYEKVREIKKLDLVIIGEYNSSFPKSTGVHYLGHIPKNVMPYIYRNAEVLVYPSFYEGFGLPIIEAFAVGIPVVTSNFGSMKEVSKDAAILVDPYNCDSIADGIFKAIKNREILITKGKIIGDSYSWSNAAKETLIVYKRLIR